MVAMEGYYWRYLWLQWRDITGSTSGCNGGILLKIHYFHWSHTSTKCKYVDDRLISLKAYLKKNVTFNCSGFADSSYQSIYFDLSIIKAKHLEEECKLFCVYWLLLAVDS